MTDLLDPVFTSIDPTYKRVGHFEYIDEGNHLHYEYLCTIGCVTCVHFCCRVAALRVAGFPQVAKKLEVNSQAKDWASNWGRMVYDKKDHGKDPKRRSTMAKMIIAMRKEKLGYGEACISGAWIGALIDR